MRQLIPVATLGALVVLVGACSSTTTDGSAASTTSTPAASAAPGPAGPSGPGGTAPSRGSVTAPGASTPSTAGPPPASDGTASSSTDFVARVTVLCANAQTKLATVFNAGALSQAVFDDGMATLRDVSTQVKAMTPPAGHDADAAALSSNLDRFVADLQQAAPGVIAGDRAAEQAIQPQINADNDAIEAAARALGLRGCLIPAGA